MRKRKKNSKFLPFLFGFPPSIWLVAHFFATFREKVGSSVLLTIDFARRVKNETGATLVVGFMCIEYFVIHNGKSRFVSWVTFLFHEWLRSQLIFYLRQI